MMGRSAGNTSDDLETKLDIDVYASERFIPYIQQYEFEALLFSSPDLTAEELSKPEKAKDLNNILRDCGGAEDIDDGETTAPAKRILDHFPGYNKVLDGPNILQSVGISTIIDACPRFAYWLQTLEKLGQEPNPVKIVRNYKIKL